MTARIVGLAGLIALGLVGPLGCKGEGGGGVPDPPTNLVANHVIGSFDAIVLTWEPPAGPITGYEAQGRMGSGPWESLGEPFTPDYGSYLAVEFEPSVPELTDFAFRLRSLRGLVPSPWSSEAPYRRGLRWPLGASASVTGEGVLLEWQNASTAATGIRIDRLFGGAWVPIASLPAAATSHLDAMPLAGPSEYRVIATAGLDESLPMPQAYCQCAGFPPAPVSALTATTEMGGIRLRWSNPKLTILGLVVYRTPLPSGSSSQVSPLLPPGTQEFFDLVPPGLYRYEVEIRFGMPVANLVTPVLGVATSTDIAGSLLGLPTAIAAARDSQGRIALAQQVWQEFRLVFRGAGAPPDLDLGTNLDMAAPHVAFDHLDRPHAMVLRSLPEQEGLVALIHVWYDGAGWREEEVARRGLDYLVNVRFAVGGAGEPSAAWTINRPALLVEHAVRDDSGWHTEDLTSLLPSSWANLVGLEVDEDGAPYLLLLADGLKLLRGGGSWTAEPVPLPAADAARVLFALPAGVGILQYRCSPGSPFEPGQLAALEWASGGWGAESLVREDPMCQPPYEEDRIGARASADGARRMAWSSLGSLRLHFREGALPWNEVEVGLQTVGARVLGGWSDAAGRFTLLVQYDFGYGEGVLSVALTER